MQTHPNNTSTITCMPLTSKLIWGHEKKGRFLDRSISNENFMIGLFLFFSTSCLLFLLPLKIQKDDFGFIGKTSHL